MYRTDALPAGTPAAPKELSTSINTFANSHKFKTLFDECMHGASTFADEALGVPPFEGILSGRDHARAAHALISEITKDTNPCVIPFCCVSNRVYAQQSEYNRVCLEDIFVDGDSTTGALPPDRMIDVRKLTFGYRHYAVEEGLKMRGAWMESPRKFWGGLLLNVFSHRLGRTVHYKVFNNSPCVQIFGGSLRQGELDACMETLLSTINRLGGSSQEAAKFALPRPIPYKARLSLENCKLDVARSCKHMEAFHAALESDLQCYKHLSSTVFPMIKETHVARGRIHIKTRATDNKEKATLSLAKTGKGLISATSFAARYEAWLCLLELLRLYPQYWRVNGESLYGHMRAQGVSPTNVVVARHPNLSLKILPTATLKRARKTLPPLGAPRPEQQQPSETAACSSSDPQSSSS